MNGLEQVKNGVRVVSIRIHEYLHLEYAFSMSTPWVHWFRLTFLLSFTTLDLIMTSIKCKSCYIKRNFPFCLCMQDDFWVSRAFCIPFRHCLLLLNKLIYTTNKKILVGPTIRLSKNLSFQLILFCWSFPILVLEFKLGVASN